MLDWTRLFREIWCQCYSWYLDRCLQSRVILFSSTRPSTKDFFVFVLIRAAHSQVPLYQYIAKLSNSTIRLPVPAFNVGFAPTSFLRHDKGTVSLDSFIQGHQWWQSCWQQTCYARIHALTNGSKNIQGSHANGFGGLPGLENLVRLFLERAKR